MYNSPPSVLAKAEIVWLNFAGAIAVDLTSKKSSFLHGGDEVGLSFADYNFGEFRHNSISLPDTDYDTIRKDNFQYSLQTVLYA